jgi:antitoxin (DNA-binding transcriptional repressor) of toxin-antitoxin stability system
MDVGTKDLKNNLSRYLRLVRAGVRVVVTDHGKAFAELRPFHAHATSDEDALRALEAEGLVTRGAGKVCPFAPVRLRGKGPLVSSLVVEDRR